MVEIINLYWNDQIEWFKKNFNKTDSNNYQTDCEKIKNALYDVIKDYKRSNTFDLDNNWLFDGPTSALTNIKLKNRCNINLIKVLPPNIKSNNIFLGVDDDYKYYIDII